MITTKGILTLLITDPKVRQELLDTFDTMEPARRGELVDTLWNAFNMFYDTQLQKNIQAGLEKIKTGDELANRDFYQRMIDKTNQDVDEQSLQAEDNSGLEEARKAMEVIVKEIQATKQAAKLAKANK